MKFEIIGWALVGLLQLTSAAPSIVKRQASEAAPVGYATMNGGTTGGIGGTVTTVTTEAGLIAAVAGDEKKIVYISGTITGTSMVDIGSNTSVLGKNSASGLVGIGLRIWRHNNVIIRNIKTSKVLKPVDAIGIQASKNVWVDHVEFSSDMTHNKDYYDGLLDITHGSDWVTVSYCHFHDHYKTSLVGHSDNNGSEDKGHLTVTYKHNYFQNINSRAPSLRFGTGHVFNNYYENISLGINTRQGAQMLIQNNVFQNVTSPLYATDEGFAVATGNDFGGGVNEAPVGTLTAMPYSFTLAATADTKAQVIAGAGNKLTIA